MMVYARGSCRRACRQPPSLGDEEIRADDGNQPDDDQKNEAHGSRPPELRTRPSPLSQCVESLGLRQWRMKRRESTIAFRECKRVLAALKNPIETALLENVEQCPAKISAETH